MKHLRQYHPDLWNTLLNLENQPDTVGSIYNTLKRLSLKQIDERFQQEDAQLTIFDILEK